MNRLLVTGSAGLIGSEMVGFFSRLGWCVHGMDNHFRAELFGPEGDTRWNLERLAAAYPGYTHHEIDIRDRDRLRALIKSVTPSLIIHAAAQPSHDLAASRPFDDFEINAAGTLNLLEAVRQECRESVFVFMSTNKVYGDAPNRIQLKELASRWDYADPLYANGIAEDFPIDQSMHSLFGVSKLSADVMVQEYGRYFGLPTCCLRCGCLTGPCHSGVELHGFLSYLIKCNVEGRPYRVYGYKGKQVRDNLHAHDVAGFAHAFWQAPHCGEIYNLGGGRENSCSILEAFERVESLSGQKMKFEYREEARKGDHICYISDLSKAQRHYPSWGVEKSITHIFQEIHSSWRAGRKGGAR